MSTSDDAPLESEGESPYRAVPADVPDPGAWRIGPGEVVLPCCPDGKGPDPCPWHPGFIVLPPPPLKADTKRIVDQVFREMGVTPESLERNVDDDRELRRDRPHVYHPPEKPVPFLGDRTTIPWGLIIFFMALAVTCAFAIGWSLNESGLL